MTNDLETTLWSFAHNEMPAEDFETWLYAHPELSRLLNKDLYLRLVSFDYEMAETLPDLRAHLLYWMHQHCEAFCDCPSDTDHHRIAPDKDARPGAFLKKFNVLIEYQEKPGIYYGECLSCKKRSLVILGSRKEWHLVRLPVTDEKLILQDHRWPLSVMEKYENYDDYIRWQKRAQKKPS